MPKIIVVQGVSNSGKTTAIIEAMNNLGIFVGSGPRDVRVSAHLHINGAGYTLGFASGGDSSAIVQENVDFFQGLKRRRPSHMVFACRSRGGGIQALDAYAAKLGVALIIVPAPSKNLVRDILKHIP